MILTMQGLRGLRGLGDCPDYAPYSTPGGGCSNVPASMANATVSQIEDSGYSFSPSGVLTSPGTPVGNSYEAGAYGHAPGGGYDAAFAAAALERSQSDADARARRAEEQGRALGLNVSCRTYQTTKTGTGNEGTFGTDCTVNGVPGNDADLLMLPGGWNIAAVEAGRVAGTPIQHVELSTTRPPRYDYIDPLIPDTLTEVRSTPPRPVNQTYVPPVQNLAPVTTTTRANSAGSTTVATTGGAPSQLERAATGSTAASATQSLLDAARGYLPAGASSALDSASTATGFSTSTLLLIAAGAALFFLTRGK